MKHVTLSMVFALAVFAASPVYASDAMKGIVGSYLGIQASLAGDNLDGVQPAAQAIG